MSCFKWISLMCYVKVCVCEVSKQFWPVIDTEKSRIIVAKRKGFILEASYEVHVCFMMIGGNRELSLLVA